MIDVSITGCCWVEVYGGDYTLPPKQQYESRCQLELSTDYRKLVAHEAVGDWSALAPLRILSFDIECAGRKGKGVKKPELDSRSCRRLSGAATRPGYSDCISYATTG